MELRQDNGFAWPLRLLAAILAIALVVGGSSAVAKLAARQNAEIKFVATQVDVPIEGQFRQFSADVDFDTVKPTSGKVSIVIDLASVDTGSADADAMLKGKDFFDTVHFPQATFASTSIMAAGVGEYRASGQFMLKGRSLALVIPFTVRPEGAGLWFEGSIPVSRLAYKVGEGEWADTGTLADQVRIRFKLYVPR
jgi:polyisoprenoid-binding protein YceI